jgi:hypothetical protein
MEPDWELMKQRIAERLQAVGLSERAASIEATGSPDTLRFLRTRNVMPSGARFSRLAFVLKATPGYLLGLGDGKNSFDDIMRGSEEDLIVPEMPSTKELGSVFPVYAGFPIILEGYSELFDAEDFEVGCLSASAPFRQLRVPLALTGKQSLYGIYMPGFAMKPVFEAGELLVVDGSQPPSSGDYAVLKIGEPISEDGDRMIVVGKVIRRSNKALTIEQVARPGQAISIFNDKFTDAHRILRTSDLMGDVR